MLKRILLTIALLIGAFLAYVGFQPREYEVARDVVIEAPAEIIFPYLNNPQKMDEWSPWSKMDTELKVEYSGPSDGVGAKSSWVGKEMGVGSATISESVENQSVTTDLEYTEPFVGTQVSTFQLEPVEAGTRLVWSVRGENNFIARIFCTLFDMKGQIGDTFSKGLTDLKSMVELGVQAE